MAKIDRYDVDIEWYDYDAARGVMEPDDRGAYVKYEDHERIVRELEDQILAYQKESEETEAYIKSRGW